MSNSLAPEQTPLQPMLEPDSILSFPRIATKNNLLKLNWWHSPTEPLENEAVFLASPGRTDTNCKVPPPIKPTMDNNNIAVCSSTSEKSTPQSHQKNSEEGPMVFSPRNCTMLDLDDDLDLKDSQLLVKADPDGFQHGIVEEFIVLQTKERVARNMPVKIVLCFICVFYMIYLSPPDTIPCVGYLNQGKEDQMKVSGYRRSLLRWILCWICIFLTGGLLRLVLHWWRHWYLLVTCLPCPLQEAQQVLIEEDYQGKHTLYHVKPVLLMTTDELRKLLQEKLPGETIDENKLQLSVHFSSAHFKSFRSLRIIRCKQLVYAWDSSINGFNKINGLDVNVPCSYFHQQRGLSIHEQLSRSIVFGYNEITIPLRDVKTLLFLEVLNPFYVFQIFSVVLWFTYDYYYYACVILLMSIFGISMSIIQTKKNQDVLHETVKNTGNAWIVNTKGHSIEVPTRSLVPGDIIEIPASGCTMQCDAVLLSGNCILDESMLTGESVPVTKTALPMKRDTIFDKKEHAKNMLFCGTKVIQTRYIGSKKVLALVINTGNITAKGGLVRSILYPPPVDYKFEQDSYKFIQFLALIACCGFIYTLVTKILRGTDAIKIVVESLDLITIVVPPALPAAMTVGRFYAQKRLKTNNIFCISPRSINVAGSIDCCCFDKTGTLTEDGLDMWGVVPKSFTNQFQIPLRDVKRLPFDHFLFGMVTCHSITVMNGKMMGDPLDLKMFDSTGWLLEDVNNIPEKEKYGLIYPTILRQPNRVISASVQRQSSVDDLLANAGLYSEDINFDHGIVREFPFSSNLQRMAVVTRCLTVQGFNVYCKGSPEMLQQLCQPESIPDDYSQQLSIFAKRGFRIIAVAYKKLSPKINYTKVQRLSREEVEQDLEFLGFVILENRLKPDTTEVINSLNVAGIRTIMITGDNILTALSVARDCGIVSPTQAVITVHAAPTFEGDKYELQYTLEMGTSWNAPPLSNGNGTSSSFALDITSISSGSHSLSSIKTQDSWTNNDDVELGGVAAPTSRSDWRRHFTFAMDGKTWQIVRERFSQEMELILTRGSIYARMSPEHKQSLVMELQNLDYYVAMCGDGANDCGALKVAHTGISLSETESSIASPFTSRNPTIAAVPNVIREGRAALVTSFGIFKYMAAYSLVQFISVMILYSIESNLTDKQYLYIDLGLISIIAFFFGKTESYDGPLAKQIPLSSLISATPLASLLLHLALVITFQVTGWYQLHQQTWFVPFKHSTENHLGCVENYTMFAISSFQYIVLAIVFSKGVPYRKSIWSNWPLCLTIVINLCIVIYLVVYPSEWIAQFFQLDVPTDKLFRYVMIAYGAAAFILHSLLESIVVEMLVFKRFQVQREQNVYTSTRKYMQLEYKIKAFENWPPITELYEPLHEPGTYEQTQPTYVNLSAEQNVDIQPGVFPGFFEIGSDRVDF